jgi:hypothetical protein
MIKEVDLKDLQEINLYSVELNKGINSKVWFSECRKSYIQYLKVSESKKTFSEWLNNQIILLNLDIVRCS